MMNNHPTDTEPKDWGELISCGLTFLGAPSLIAIVLLLGLLAIGVPSAMLEKSMVWLSVPWFALCYALCKAAHGTKIIIVDSDGNPIETPSKN